MFTCEAGSGLSHDNSHTRPADILVPNWYCSRPAAALDLTVISPLNSNVIAEARFTGGSVAASAEVRKHSENDQKCEELGWICVPLAVEGYGTWGHGNTAHLLTFGPQALHQNQTDHVQGSYGSTWSSEHVTS